MFLIGIPPTYLSEVALRECMGRGGGGGGGGSDKGGSTVL